MQEHAWQWSAETFGQARLGDSWRVRRLVQIGARATERPHGRISQVFSVKREMEAAYDFVECGNVPASAIVEAVCGATARGVGDSSFVFAPVDGTSLKLWDGTGQKDFGRIGTHANGASGLKVMSSLLVSPEGVPLGLSGQVFWSRPRKRRKRTHHGNRAVADKETQHWVEAFDQVHSCRDADAFGTKIWYQLDRGGDAWTILQDLATRAEKLKHLSRQTPDAPASIDLTNAEEETLRLLRTEYGPRKERQPSQLTIALAVNWIAEMGGYTGKSSGGPPGSITIQRGLEHLTIATATLTLFKQRQK